MTSRSDLVIAVIPAYNEAKTIAEVVRGLLPKVDRIVVVDDASSDGTGALAQEAGATVVAHETNKGYDQTINDGFHAAYTSGAGIIMTFDADGEHDANDVPAILAPIREGKADIVLGQRPETRHWSEDILSFYTKVRYGIPDPLCGMKAYRRDVYERVGFFDSLSSIGTELSIRGIGLGFRSALVPITLHARADGDRSRFYQFSLRGNLKILSALWRILWI